MDQSSLLRAMAREVEAQCRECMAEAGKQAAGIVSQATEKHAGRRAELLEAARQASVRQIAKERGRALADAARREEAFEGTITEEVLVETRMAIDGLAQSEEFTKVLEALLDEALRGLTGPLEVVAPTGKVDNCNRWLRSKGLDDVKVVPDGTMRDGIAVQDPQRSFRLTNTLSSRCAQIKSQIRQICSEKLKSKGN